MTPIDLGGVASWILAALIGLAILYAVANQIIGASYKFLGITIPMETLGIGVLLVALILGGIYFLKDLLNKF